MCRRRSAHGLQTDWYGQESAVRRAGVRSSHPCATNRIGLAGVAPDVPRRPSLEEHRKHMMKPDTDVIPTVGDLLPDWRLPALDGSKFHPETLRGKRVLLFVWGSW